MGTPQLHATTCKCTSAYWVWICRYTIYEHALRTSAHVPCCFWWFMMPCIFWLLLHELTCCRCARNLQQSKCPKPYSLKFEIRTSRKTIHFDRGCMRGNSLYRNVVQHTNSWHSCNYTILYVYIYLYIHTWYMYTPRTFGAWFGPNALRIGSHWLLVIAGSEVSLFNSS